MTAGKRHLHAAAQADAMYSRDGRDAQRVQGSEDALSETRTLCSLHRILDGFDSSDVRPRDEPALCAPQHGHAHLCSGGQIPHLPQKLPQSRKHLLAEHIYFALRVVEGDPGNPLIVDLKRRIREGRRVDAYGFGRRL